MNAKDTAKAKIATIESQLAQLTAIVAKYKGEIPDAHWGHIGDLGRIERELKDLLECYPSE